MMRIEAFDTGDLHLLRRQHRSNEGRVDAVLNNERFVRAMVEGGPSYAISDRAGRLLVCCGIILYGASPGIAWWQFDQHAPRHLVGLHRALLDLLGRHSSRRVEAMLIQDAEYNANYASQRRWLEMLDFRLEHAYPNAFDVFAREGR